MRKSMRPMFYGILIFFGSGVLWVLFSIIAGFGLAFSGQSPLMPFVTLFGLLFFFSLPVNKKSYASPTSISYPSERCFEKNRFRFESLIILVFYCVLAFIAFRGILLQNGTLGHNWDWSIPPLSIQLRNKADNVFYVWKELSLGYFGFLELSTIFFTFTFSVLGYAGISGEFVSKFLPFITIVLSGTSMFYLVEDILLKKTSKAKTNLEGTIFFSSLMAGYFYALSPFLFCEFIGGAATQFFSYSFLPLTVLLFRKVTEDSKKAHMISTAIVLSVVSISLQNLLLISIILSLYALTRTNPQKSFEKLVATYLLYLPFNAYWILPTFSSLGVELHSYLAGGFFLPNIEFSVPSLVEIFMGTGYFRPFFIWSINPRVIGIWLLCSLSMICLLFASVFLVIKRDKESLFWSILLLLSFGVATGGKSPLGGLIIWMYENISVMILFKSPQHFMVLPTLFLAILLGIGVFGLIHKIMSGLTKKRFLVYLILLVIITVWISPFFTGNLGMNYLEDRGGGNFVANFQLSPGYVDILHQLDSQTGDFRVLYLPVSGSPYYLETEYQREGQGGDPIVVYSQHSTIVSDLAPSPVAQQIGLLLEETLYRDNVPKDVSKLLGQMNVKYIILRSDIRPHFSPFVNSWNHSWIYRFLKENTRISFVKEYEYISLWENLDFLPHILVPNGVGYVEGNLSAIASLLDANIFDPHVAYFFSNSTPDESKNAILAHSTTLIIYKDAVDTCAKEGWTIIRDGGFNTLGTVFAKHPNASVSYSFYAPEDGVYRIFALVRWDGARGMLRYKIDDGDWSAPTTPFYGKKGQLQPFYYKNLMLGESILSKGNHTMALMNYVDLNISPGYQNIASIFLIKSKPANQTTNAGITFEKINPTKYIVHVNASQPFFLVFSESYHEDWIANADGQEVPNEYHFTVNGYANAWYLNKTGSYNVTLEFWPQRLFYIGAAISIATFTICMVYLGKDQIKTLPQTIIKRCGKNLSRNKH